MTEDRPQSPPPNHKVLPNWLIALMIVGAVAGGVAAIWLSLIHLTSPDTGPRLEAVKFGATVFVGLCGLVALWLNAKRQRSTELAIAEQARIAREIDEDRKADRAQREKVADDARQDAIERRITELYTKAAEQLGSDKAPVRLAALYALSRLADDNAAHRQTVVNLLCAYLRMNVDVYEPPVVEKKGVITKTIVGTSESWKEEAHVRSAAQRVLEDGLRRWSLGYSHRDDPWDERHALRVDLEGAELVGLYISGVALSYLNLRAARIKGRLDLELLKLVEVDLSGVECTGPAILNSVEIYQIEFPFGSRSLFEFSNVTFKESARVRWGDNPANLNFIACRTEAKIDFEGVRFEGFPQFDIAGEFEVGGCALLQPEAEIPPGYRADELIDGARLLVKGSNPENSNAEPEVGWSERPFR